MESINAKLEAGVLEAFDKPPDNKTATPLASGPHHGDACSPDGDSMRASANQESTAHNAPDISKEIQVLKKKILELEQSSKRGPVDSGNKAQLMDDMEQYQRMEACLYKHRKEWEAKGGPDDWGLVYEGSKGLRDRVGPWSTRYELSTWPPYKRPDPFLFSHNCGNAPNDADAGAQDDFDHVIDYGSRRERLRKNFEWETDRLYLAEEFERRRIAKVNERHQADETKPPEPEEPILHAIEPKLHKMEWFSFKEMSGVNTLGGCVVEILEGEPVIDDGLGAYRMWYGSSGRRSRKSKGLRNRNAFDQAPQGQVPLPERIRIRSLPLLRIISTILRSDQDVSRTEVLIRPFKALVFCERGLRDWYHALERRLAAGASTRRDSTANHPDSNPNSARDTISSTEPEVSDGKGEVENNATCVNDAGSTEALEAAGAGKEQPSDQGHH